MTREQRYGNKDKDTGVASLYVFDPDFIRDEIEADRCSTRDENAVDA
jgi:hypothetical protein